MRARHRLSTSLGLVLGLLACGMFDVSAQDIAPPGSMLLNPMKSIERAALKGFLERPLFDPSRRLPPVTPPVVAETPIVVVPPEPPPALHLLGVVQGERNMAIVHRDGEDKTVILRSGDHVGGWNVTVLPSVGIRLHNGNRAFDYAMFSKANDVGPSAVTDLDRGTKATEMSDAMAARNARLQKRSY